jgi:hypothetical protein
MRSEWPIPLLRLASAPDWLRLSDVASALVIDARGDFDGVSSISSSDTVVDEKTVWPVAKSPATDFLPYSACLSGFLRSVR